MPSGDVAPWHAKALELLADGLWREQDWVLNRVIPLVPPGRALRRCERERARQSDKPRSRYRSEQYLIYVGARMIVVESLRGSTRLERKVEDGKVWLRRKRSETDEDTDHRGVPGPRRREGQLGEVPARADGPRMERPDGPVRGRTAGNRGRPGP